MAQICGNILNWQIFFVLEVVAKNYRERGKNAAPVAAFY
jgi:hypothetical protein